MKFDRVCALFLPMLLASGVALVASGVGARAVEPYVEDPEGDWYGFYEGQAYELVMSEDGQVCPAVTDALNQGRRQHSLYTDPMFVRWSYLVDPSHPPRGESGLVAKYVISDLFNVGQPEVIVKLRWDN